MVQLLTSYYQYSVPVLVPDEFEAVNVRFLVGYCNALWLTPVSQVAKITVEGRASSWFLRRILKRTTSQPINIRTEKQVRQKRSISDLNLRMNPRKDSLKEKSLDDLIRLCGSSPLYLPLDYAPCTLRVPTCFRATAQHLVQHGMIPRVP